MTDDKLTPEQALDYIDEYVKHDLDCTMLLGATQNPMPDCNCGLTEVFQAVDFLRTAIAEAPVLRQQLKEFDETLKVTARVCSEITAENETLRARIQELEHEVDDLRSYIKYHKSHHTARYVTDITKENESLRTRVQELEHGRIGLLEELRDVKSELAAVTIGEGLAEAKNEQLRKALTDARAVVAAIHGQSDPQSPHCSERVSLHAIHTAAWSLLDLFDEALKPADSAGETNAGR